MTSNSGSSPFRSPQFAGSESSLVLPRVRDSSRSSIASRRQRGLPSPRSSSSLSALFASTSGTSSPRPSSRAGGTPPVYPLTGAVFTPGKTPNASSAPPDVPDAYRELVIRSFAPHVAVLASTDTEVLLAQKGFVGGFLQLIRPYGERVHGRVTIRDSTGQSKRWDNFSIRFTKLKDGLRSPRTSAKPSTDTRTQNVDGYLNKYLPDTSGRMRTGGDVPFIEEAVEKHLSYAEGDSGMQSEEDYLNYKDHADTHSPWASPFHLLYLRRLLSGLPLSPHETFSHPVACVIAISSRNPDPIDELRQLYAATSTGDQRLPQWVSNDYLRYYVLVHDEDHDDIQKSTALYEQMKRHFGLHCHLLRLRSSQCVTSDDDCTRLPLCDWISASEELAEIERRESFDAIDDPTPCLFDSDIMAIKTFVREMVTQSVVPTMERLTAMWNDQIASRRRGISGRFLSLSKKWTPFGSSSRNSSGSVVSGSSGSNYDPLQGFYLPETPEAIMRKLADYAFMLRDFKLANTTYDILRQDFNTDKAWKYYAGANEMAAISALIGQQSLTTKAKVDAIDNMLQTATYSYITRCSAPYNALRTLAVAVEALKTRGGSAIDDAARWACRITELDLVGPIGHALFAERIASYYASRVGIGSLYWGCRWRKAALWGVLAVEAWLKLDMLLPSQACLAETIKLYRFGIKDLPVPLAFDGMTVFIQELRDTLAASKDVGTVDMLVEKAPEGQDGTDEVEEVQREKLDIRSHRLSVIGINTSTLDPLGAMPVTPTRKSPGEAPLIDDKFE